MPGAMADARWMMTASVIEDVTQIRSPKVRVAHRRMSSAEASARSSAARATICSIRCGSSCDEASSATGSLVIAAAELTGPLLLRRNGAGNCECSFGSASPRRRLTAARDPLRRSTGSRTERRGRYGWSRQLLLTRAPSPFGERLTRLLAGCEAAENSFYVVREFLGRRLQAPDLPPETGRGAVTAAQAAAQVDLEAFDLLAVGARDQ